MRQIGVIAAISTGFLLLHIALSSLPIGDTGMLIATLVAMIAMQVIAFRTLPASKDDRPITFTIVFIRLSLTMTFAVILLALNSAFNPYVDHKPLNYGEILISLVLFSGVFTLITSSVIWWIAKKKINP